MNGKCALCYSKRGEYFDHLSPCLCWEEKEQEYHEIIKSLIHRLEDNWHHTTMDCVWFPDLGINMCSCGWPNFIRSLPLFAQKFINEKYVTRDEWREIKKQLDIIPFSK